MKEIRWMNEENRMDTVFPQTNQGQTKEKKTKQNRKTIALIR